MKKSALHFLVAARQCEIGELEQLMRTSALVSLLGRLIHALQKERGLSNIFLASAGARGTGALAAQVEDCERIALDVRSGFDHLDTTARNTGAGMGQGARLFSRIAYVLQGLDALPALRQRIASRAATPEAATAAFMKLVAGLLAVVFEAADSAADPEISRLLVAQFHFMQGKEFAGQERAAGAAAFGSGVSEAARQQHWLHLIDVQERSFQAFAEFAPPEPLSLWRETAVAGAMLAAIERLRRVGCTALPGSALDAQLSEAWFDATTRRMDAMQAIEVRLAADLLQLCERKIAEARAGLQAQQALLGAPPLQDAAAFFDTPGDARVPSPGLGPHLDRSVLELVQEQSLRLQAMQGELETVRAALQERKLVERAKGLLMAHRQLGEGEAHKLLRQTAMNQNRRLADVAQAVLSMADLLPPAAPTDS